MKHLVPLSGVWTKIILIISDELVSSLVWSVDEYHPGILVGKNVRRACTNFVGRNAHSQRMHIANLYRSSQRRTSCAFTTNAHVNFATHAQYAFAANAQCDLLVKFSKPNEMRIHYECSMRLPSEVRKTFPIRIRRECSMRPSREVLKPNKMRILCECSMRLSSEVRQTFLIRICCECVMRPCSEDAEADLDAHSLRMRCATF